MKVPSVKDYLRNHTNIVTVDKKSVFLYLHQDGYNDKDDFLFLAVTRKYAFPLRPLVNQKPVSFPTFIPKQIWDLTLSDYHMLSDYWMLLDYRILSGY